MPKGEVLTIALLLLLCFLGEGAILDWSALLLAQEKQVDVSVSGAGFAIFSLAMTSVRLIGDRLVALLGERVLLGVGFLGTGVGVALTAFAESLPGVLAALFVAGASVANVVPVLFTLAGRQRIMQAQSAIAVVSIFGYLGVLMGPAVIGYLAQGIGLSNAFYMLALSLVVAVTALPSLMKS